MDTLFTPRLILRPWKSEDLKDLYEYAKSPLVGPSAGWSPHTDIETSREALNGFIRRGHVLAVYHRDDKKVIGTIGLYGDEKRSISGVKMLGYSLSEKYWGKGLATEAAKRFVVYVFETRRPPVLSAYCFTENERSRRVLEKCGFVFEGIMRCAVRRYDGMLFDEACYSMTPSDYKKFYGIADTSVFIHS